MGYRNYFYIAEKEKVNKFLSLSHEDQVKVTAEMARNQYNDPVFAQERVEEYIEWNNLGSWETRDYLEAEEIHGCGKYFDYNIQKEIVKDSIDLSNSDEELYFNVKPEALIICAEHYKDKSAKYWHNLIDTENDLEVLKERLRSLVRELDYKHLDVLNTDPKNKFNITNSWDYEYAMFELVHLYKLIDWDKYSLIWCGY